MEDKKFKKEVTQYWDEGSSDYDTAPGHGLFHEEEKQEWLKALKDLVPEGADVLDVGCGTGFLTLLLAEMGHSVKGVDLSEGMQADAKRKVNEKGFEDRVTFAIGDAEMLDEPDEKYDVVINRHLLWTLPHPDIAINEWLRVIRPGGRVVVLDGDWKLYAKKAKELEEKRLKGELEDEHKGKKGHGGRAYSKEMNDNLPSRTGEKEVTDFFPKEGIELEIKRLKDVEDVERRLFPDSEWMALDERKRLAYILKKV